YAQAPKLPSMGAGLALLGRRRDGSDFPIDVLLKPIDANMASPTIAIVRDMTERQQREDALRQARDSARRANEVKSRFLAAANHDLRQPLQTIWSLQTVLARALKDTEYAAHLALLEDSVRSMDRILSSLIDINRLERGAIQQFPHQSKRRLPREQRTGSKCSILKTTRGSQYPWRCFSDWRGTMLLAPPRATMRCSTFKLMVCVQI